MDNKSIANQTVMSQCMKMLNLEDYPCTFRDHRVKKLYTHTSVLLFIEAQLQKRQSYREIAEHLRSDRDFQALLQLESVHPSQLSRKIRTLSITLLHELFLSVTERIREKTKSMKGVPSPREKYQKKDKFNIGKLNIVDSSRLKLPFIPGKWAQATSTSAGVKFHLRFIAAAPGVGFADRVVFSTADVADHDKQVLQELVIPDDATYVFDRGYISFERFTEWLHNKIQFVIRIQDKNRIEVIEERPLRDKHPHIVRDALVRLGNMEYTVRLVEFKDEKERTYRLITNRMDLQAHEIAEVYRYRWLIELFFKWMKQHLRLVKLYSYDEKGIWNQILLALIAYGLCTLVHLELQTSKSVWEVLVLLRLYAKHTWEEFETALFRPPTRTSKGRKKKGGRPRGSTEGGTRKKKVKAPQIICKPRI